MGFPKFRQFTEKKRHSKYYIIRLRMFRCSILLKANDVDIEYVFCHQDTIMMSFVSIKSKIVTCQNAKGLNIEIDTDIV